MRARDWTLMAALAASVAAHAFAYDTVPRTGGLLHVGTVSALLSLAVFSLGVWRNRPRPPTAWIGIGFFLITWFIGDAFYDRAGTHPALSIADLFYIAGALAMIAALILCNVRHLVDAPRDALIESGLVAIVAAVAAWLFIIEPVVIHDAVPLLATRWLVVLYPLTSVVAIFLIARLLFSGGRNTSALLLGAGFIVGLLADGAYAYFQQTASFATANLAAADTAWLAMYALVAAAAWHPSMRRLVRPVAASSTRASWQLAIAGAALLTIPALFAAGALVSHGVHPAELVVASAATIPLILWRLLALHRSVSETTAKLAARERYFAQIAHHLSDSYVVLDDRGRILDASGDLNAAFGTEQPALLGARLNDLIDDAEHIDDALTQLVQQPAATAILETPVSVPSGQRRHLELRATNLLADPIIAGIIVNVRDITLRKRAEAEAQRQALHDTLTGLANRALLRDRMEQALVRRRQHGNDVLLIFCGLDSFKDVNESLGHERGDDLLCAIAKRLEHAVSSSDTIARLGGDEFAALVEIDAHDPAHVDELAESVRRAATAPFRIGGLSIAVTASVGVALASDDNAETVDDLLRIADSALHAAKARGRDQIARTSPASAPTSTTKMELASDLRGAVQRNELLLHYQPIFNLMTNEIVGLEALVRWDHPTRGLLAPQEFIAIAERSGTIVDVGTWVLRQACGAAAGFGDDVLLSVNVAPRQLQDPAIVQHISAALAESSLDPQRLVLELTETAIVGNVEDAVRRLSDISDLGVKIAIDDFGVGFASIDYLRRFPTDILKIDASYIHPITDTDDVSGLVRGLLGLGRSLNLTMIAEGIETSPQLEALRREGCLYGQGFMLERAIPEHRARQLVADDMAAGRGPSTF